MACTFGRYALRDAAVFKTASNRVVKYYHHRFAIYVGRCAGVPAVLRVRTIGNAYSFYQWRVNFQTWISLVQKVKRYRVSTSGISLEHWSNAWTFKRRRRSSYIAEPLKCYSLNVQLMSLRRLRWVLKRCRFSGQGIDFFFSCGDRTLDRYCFSIF